MLSEVFVVKFPYALCVCSVKEACIILCLNMGSAILLKNLLKRSTQDPGDQDRAGESSPESALNEMGVYCLAPCDVMILLNLRASLPQI